MKTLGVLVVAAVWFAAGFGARGVLEEPPPAALPEPAVVRMLDITIRDSNTTNRRQRFECRPVEKPVEVKR